MPAAHAGSSQVGPTNDVEREVVERIRAWRSSLPPPVSPRRVPREPESELPSTCVLLGVSCAGVGVFAAAYGRVDLLSAGLMVGACLFYLGVVLHRRQHGPPRARERHATGLRAMLHASGGVVYRPALEIPPAKLDELIREFELVEDGEYLVDHSTFSYLVMPEHGFVEYFRREMTPEAMADTIGCFVDKL